MKAEKKVRSFSRETVVPPPARQKFLPTPLATRPTVRLNTAIMQFNDRISAVATVVSLYTVQRKLLTVGYSRLRVVATYTGPRLQKRTKYSLL